MDGITTTALAYSILHSLGIACVARVARRDAGYGFGRDDALFFAQNECDLIITGDCGTSDFAAIQVAKEHGIEVIVVDHHTVPDVGDIGTHPSLALVNPFRSDSTFPFRGMASVGLMFYLFASVRTGLRDAGYFCGGKQLDLRSVLDLVALGTVADLVPLQGENRILTWFGLRELRRRRRPGISFLLEAAGVGRDQHVDESTIGWKLGPRLNAPGRLGDATPALELLLAQNERDAQHWAEQLEQLNERRRFEQNSVLQQALEMLEGRDPGPCVVVWGRGWKSGVVGIVAAKLVEKYDRPAFVVAMDEESGIGRGSARSVEGINLYDLLATCGDVLERFGGHSAAAGFTIEADRMQKLREMLWSAMGSCTVRDNRSGACVDAEVTLQAVDHQLVTELSALGPFGNGNRQPLLMCRDAVVRDSRCVGDGSHLKLTLEDGTGTAKSAIAFGWGAQDPGVGARIDAAFAPMVNTWRGRSQVELEIRHMSKLGC